MFQPVKEDMNEVISYWQCRLSRTLAALTATIVLEIGVQSD